MHRRGHTEKNGSGFTISSNAALRRQSARKLQEKRTASKVSDIKNLRLHGLASEMQDFLSQSKRMPSSQVRTGTRTGSINPFERETLWQQWMTHGKPSVKQIGLEEWTGPVFKSGKPRAHYGWDNTLNISPGNVQDFLAELSHASQVSKKGKKTMIEQYRGEVEKYGHPSSEEPGKRSEKMYDVHGTMEYEAHSEIEPKLWKELWKSTPESYLRHIGW